MLKLSVCCCTYNRPEWLGELIASYEMQYYPSKYRELIILDDAGQYGDLRGNGWQIVSFPRRFASLGEKRNACVSLSSPDTDFWVVADDDDIYLPHWLESHAANFEAGALWSMAESAYWSKEDRIVERWHYRNDTFLMHPGHAFAKEIFWKCGAYPRMAGYEDTELFKALANDGIEHRNALRGQQIPFLIYRHFSDGNHMCRVSIQRYQNRRAELPKARLEVGWRRNYFEDIETFEKNRL